MQDNIDDILALRRVPPPAGMLAERVIAASRQMPKPAHSGLGEFWRIFTEEFLLPQPAFALAVVLVAGITFGFSWNPEDMFSDTDTAAAAQFSAAGNIDIEEDLL